MNADFLLIQKMKQGDETSFEAFVRKYYEEILNYCHYHCFDRDYAEDLAQEFGFYPEFTVQDYLLYIASIKGLRPAVAPKRVKQLIVRVGLSKAADRKMKKLSGGMKRKAGVAQAMLNDPEILVLDEPTAGLDPNERIRFRNLSNMKAGNEDAVV